MTSIRSVLKSDWWDTGVTFGRFTVMGASMLATAAAGKNAQELANMSADRLRQIGDQEYLLRGIQAAQSRGAEKASFVGSGVDVNTGTAVDIMMQNAWLDGIDQWRAKFRFESLADQVERRGESAWTSSLLSAMGQGNEMAELATFALRAEEMKDVQRRNELARNPTLLGQSSVKFPGAGPKPRGPRVHESTSVKAIDSLGVPGLGDLISG